MHGDSEANAAQAEYWNSEPGRTWIDMESALDASMAAILDLVIARADPRPGEHVLDIGCGTGASTLRAAAAVGGGGRVLGADISGLLLARARARAREARLENASFEVCDAQVHDFPPAVFDLMLSRFGVMFFGEPVAAFRNIARALRPGGRMAFICWAAAERNPWFAIPLEAAVGRLGRPPAADPNAPGPLAFRDRERVADLLRSAGLEKVTAREEATVLTPPGNRRQVAAMAVRLGPATRVVRHFDGTDADRAAIEEEVFARLEPYATGQGVRIPAAVNVFAAVRG